MRRAFSNMMIAPPITCGRLLTCRTPTRCFCPDQSALNSRLVKPKPKENHMSKNTSELTNYIQFIGGGGRLKGNIGSISNDFDVSG